MNKLMLSLIRHGKTEANEKHLYCGKSDIHLSENGINELNDIKSSIKYPECNNFFSSGAKRANETLEIFYDNSKSFYEHQPSCGRGYTLTLEKKDKGFKIIKIDNI